MGTTAEQKADTQEDKELSFSDRVNKAVKEMKVNDKGVYELPEGLPEEVKVAAMAEKKFRDTQSAYTKVNQKVKALEAEKSVLVTEVVDNSPVELSEEQKEELEELKFSDPEAWRKKLNRYETEARNNKKTTIDEKVKKVSSSNLAEQELENRKQVLADFKDAHPEFDLDDDKIANDIPPRITKKLESGTITFEQFLEECYEYTKKGKVIKQDNDTGQQRPNMSRMSGGSKPDDNAVREDLVKSYAKEVY